MFASFNYQMYLEEACFVFHQFSYILELILSKVMMSDVWTWKDNGAQSWLGSCIGVSIDSNSNALITFQQTKRHVLGIVKSVSVSFLIHATYIWMIWVLT